MADYRYYPPIVDSYLPAFVADGSALKVYFGLSKYNSITDFSSVQVSVKKQNTGLSIVNTSEKETTTEIQTGDGVSTVFSVSNDILVVTNISIDDIDTSNFTVQDERTIEIFTMPGDVAPAGSEIKITYQYQATNRYRATGIILNLTPTKVNNTDNLYYVRILNEDIKDGWASGTIYQIQLRLSSVNYDGSLGESTWLNNNANNFSEWSTICITKAIGNPSFTATIPGMTEDILDTSSLVFKGYYTNTDKSESLNNYKLSLIYNNNILEETEILHPELQSAGKQFLSYSFKTELEDQLTYTIQASFETINKYTFTQYYTFTVDFSQEDFNKVTLSTVENDNNEVMNFSSITREEDDGRVCLRVDLDDTIIFPLTLCIRRSDYLSNFTKWEDFKILNFEEYTEYSIFYDYTVQSGIFYKYGIQKIDDEGKRSILKIVENPIIRTFEFSFLLGKNNQQLKLKFNNIMNNYKYNINEGKTDTLGGTFATISRNAKTYYQSFPINGLISFNMDENNLFITKEELFKGFQDLFDQYNRNNELGLYDMTYEREFRKEVLKFLQDGKPKLFKSPSEGNVIVRLLNVNCSPDKVTNRLIYSFSSEGVELAENNFDNYREFGFIDKAISENETPIPPGPTPPSEQSVPMIISEIWRLPSYNSINYLFNNSIKYENVFDTIDSEIPVTYKIENNTLYIATEAPYFHWFYNTTNMAPGSSGSNFFPSSLQGDLNNLFVQESFDKTYDMKYAFTSSQNITGKAICGNNTLDLTYTYYDCKNLQEPACGDNVRTMYSTYYNCFKFTDAVCGNNVIYMDNTYYRCSNLVNAACGPNVKYMNYTYNYCDNLINAACGNNVIVMNNTYGWCNNLINAVCGPKVDVMDNTYIYCNKLINAICGPNVTKMVYTYRQCNNLINAVCGDNVTNMWHTYEYCNNIIDPICGDNVKIFDHVYSYCNNLAGEPVIGNSVLWASGAYFNCKNLSGNPSFGSMEGELQNYYMNFYETYRNCPNLYGNVNINYCTNNNYINFQNCMYGRSNSQRLNVYIKYDNVNRDFCNAYYLFGPDSRTQWNLMEYGVYNEKYNVYVYRNKFNYLNTAYFLNYPLTPNYTLQNNYNSIVYEFSSSNVYPNNYNTEGCPAYWKVENNNLYIATPAEHIYFYENLIPSHKTHYYDIGFVGINLEGNLNEIFDINMFNFVFRMKNTFERCNKLTGSAICPDNVVSLDNCYWGCENITEAVCGNNVVNMDYAYYQCYNLTNAVCGPNVKSMNYTYSCYLYSSYYPPMNIINAVCGDKVEEMYYTYYGCNNLLTAACGNNVINLVHTYESCNFLTEAVCGPNVINMQSAYGGCRNLLFINVGEKVTDLSHTFQWCNNIQGQPLCPNSVINFNGTYSSCSNLTGPAVCGSNVVDMAQTYSDCYNMTGEPACGPNVINMAYTYQNCYNLTGNAACGNNVTDMTCTYINCNNIINAACGEKVTNMWNTYTNCSNLLIAKCGNNVQYMNYTYYNCGKLTKAECGDNVINMYYTYSRCYNLLDAVCGNNVTYMYSSFSQCYNLINATCGNNVIDMILTYENCNNIKRAIIGINVENAIYTFNNAKNIEDIYIYKTNIPYNFYNTFSILNNSQVTNIWIIENSLFNNWFYENANKMFSITSKIIWDLQSDGTYKNSYYNLDVKYL